MGSYKEHQNLIKLFKLKAGKEIKNCRFFDRHVGLLFTKRGTPININKKGMADLYGIINLGKFCIHIEIEAKTGNSVQSKDQKIWESFVNNFNSKYFLMRDEEKTIAEIKQYIDDCLHNVYGK